MDISKLHYFIILIMLSCGTIVSSCKKIMTEPERTVINLTACVVDRDFVGFQMSGEKGEIGVFVTETGTEKIIEDYANLQYNTVFDTGIMTLTPKASEQIYFSESGSFADIMGYYPIL